MSILTESLGQTAKAWTLSWYTYQIYLDESLTDTIENLG